jgi:hypothetical protein
VISLRMSCLSENYSGLNSSSCKVLRPPFRPYHSCTIRFSRQGLRGSGQGGWCRNYHGLRGATLCIGGSASDIQAGVNARAPVPRSRPRCLSKSLSDAGTISSVMFQVQHKYCNSFIEVMVFCLQLSACKRNRRLCGLNEQATVALM